MNRSFRISSVAAAILATTLAGSAGAWADGGRHNSDRYSYRHQEQSRHHGQHYDRRQGHKGKAYSKGYYRGYPRGYKGYYKDHHDDDEEKLLIGLLVGGLVGYAIGNQPTVTDYGANSYPPAGPQSQVEVYPAPQYSYGSGSTCLQEREYQTKVIVGGKQVDAYGTACLQPDGSWRRGPAQLVSY
jgi:surface antigen